MRKIRLIVMAVLCGFMAACTTSVDGLIDDYEKAVKNHDYKKQMKIADELDKRELTPEQTERFLNIAFNR